MHIAQVDVNMAIRQHVTGDTAAQARRWAGVISCAIAPYGKTRNAPPGGAEVGGLTDLAAPPYHADLLADGRRASRTPQPHL